MVLAQNGMLMTSRLNGSGTGWGYICQLAGYVGHFCRLTYSTKQGGGVGGGVQGFITLFTPLFLGFPNPEAAL